MIQQRKERGLGVAASPVRGHRSRFKFWPKASGQMPVMRRYPAPAHSKSMTRPIFGLPPARRLTTGNTTLHLNPEPSGRPLLAISEKHSKVVLFIPLHDLFVVAAQIACTRQLQLSSRHVLDLERADAFRLARHLRKFHTPQLKYSFYPHDDGQRRFEVCDRQVIGGNGKPFGVVGEEIPDWAWQHFDPQREARQLFAQSLREQSPAVPSGGTYTNPRPAEWGSGNQAAWWEPPKMNGSIFG